MKKKRGYEGPYQYLTMCMSIGLGLGTCAGIVICFILKQSLGFGIARGAGFGMLLGVVVGTVLDDAGKGKQ